MLLKVMDVEFVTVITLIVFVSEFEPIEFCAMKDRYPLVPGVIELRFSVAVVVPVANTNPFNAIILQTSPLRQVAVITWFPAKVLAITSLAFKENDSVGVVVAITIGVAIKSSISIGKSFLISSPFILLTPSI
jgi:hypothetical protein